MIILTYALSAKSLFSDGQVENAQENKTEIWDFLRVHMKFSKLSSISLGIFKALKSYIFLQLGQQRSLMEKVKHG